MSIDNLNPSKVKTFKNIPTIYLKVTPDVCILFLAAIWNQELKKLKLVDIILLQKKDNSTKVKSYRPFSILLTLSEIFEQSTQNQISEYINHFLPPFLHGLKKGISAQTALVEKWKHHLDRKGFAGLILMDRSEAFDTINYDLLIAYGFGKNASDLVYS